MEFAVVVIQFAAFIVRMGTLSDEELDALYPNGCPKMPVLLCLTDNNTAKSWAHRVTTKSVRGQQLIGIYAQLLRLHKFGINTEHIPGVVNVLADFISRPTHFDLTHAQRSEQIFQSHPLMRTYDYFLPSPELLQLLTSRLYSKHNPVPCVLPQVLGQFVPAGCTTFGSVVL